MGVVRRVTLFLGDRAMAGTRPVSELAEINAAYDDVQTDCQIWNQQTGAWENMQPGVNTNPSASGTDRWSFESRYREAIRTLQPTGTHYVIKHAVDSMVAHTSAKTSWLPGITGNAYATLISTITAAAAAAVLAGDTLAFEFAVVCFVTDDWKSDSTSLPYGKNIQGILTSLRTAIPGISGCSVTGGMPAAIIEPHYSYSVLDVNTQFRIWLMRASLSYLTFAPLLQAEMVRSHSMAAAADNETFSAAAMVAMAARIGLVRSPVAPGDVSSTEAPLIGIFGDSIFEGTGDNSQLPAHLTGPLTGVNILNWKSQAFQTLQAGTNNLVSLDGYPLHGPEVYLGELLRALWGSVWIVKGTSIGSTTYFWAPYFQAYFFDAFLRGWLRNAIQVLRASGKKPVAKLIAISLGTNDIIDTTKLASDVVLNLKMFMDNVKRELDAEAVDRTGLKFILLVPSSTIPSDSTRRTTVREGIQRLPEERSDVAVVDLSSHQLFDNIHLTTSGTDSVAQEIFDLYREDTNLEEIETLFCPSKAYLKKALKLSAVQKENDGYAQIDSAIQTIRVRFFQQLGEARVAAISALPYSPNAVTLAQQTRSLAVSTEIKWVYYELRRSMPTLFKAGTGIIQTWDAEAAFRDGTGYLENRDELKRLESEILEALDTLRKTALDASGRILMTAVGPEDNAKPGDSVFKVI